MFQGLWLSQGEGTRDTVDRVRLFMRMASGAHPCQRVFLVHTREASGFAVEWDGVTSYYKSQPPLTSSRGSQPCSGRDCSQASWSFFFFPSLEEGGAISSHSSAEWKRWVGWAYMLRYCAQVPKVGAGRAGAVSVESREDSVSSSGVFTLPCCYQNPHWQNDKEVHCLKQGGWTPSPNPDCWASPLSLRAQHESHRAGHQHNLLHRPCPLSQVPFPSWGRPGH